MAKARVERRLAAILAADVAGYSRLMGVDEEGTLAALKAVRRELIDPKIAEHNGRMVKTTGDGVLVEFGSVVDAVRCAMEIQRTMAERNATTPEERRIEFRIGINVGDIIIDENDIYGDGVNIAARIETLASPSAICLSDNAYQQIKGKLAVDVNDMGEQQLKNIAQPVRAYSVRLEGTPVHPSLVVPDKPSIAVLPFTNLSGDPEQEYFADGVVEDILTALARVKGFFVIARNSSFTYKGRAVDVKQIGRELGVRYVLEGSVRKAANRVRITAQLIEAETGSHVWAEKYDGELNEIFDLQDQITSSVVGALEPNVLAAEIERSKRKRPGNLTAYDVFLRANWKLYSWTAEDITQSLFYLRKAIESDPGYAPAYAMAAQCYVNRITQGFSEHVELDRSEGVKLARTAIKIDRDDPATLTMVGHAIAFLERAHSEAIALLDRSLELNPNSAFSYCMSGWTRFYAGDGKTAIEHLLKGMRLSPKDPKMFLFTSALAGAYFLIEQYDEGSRWGSIAINQEPIWSASYGFLSANQALAGDIEAAKATMARLLKLQPHYIAGGRIQHWASREARDRYLRAHRLAGAPE
jgi:TolB-like protein/class 3 adenylate cyclase